MRKSNISLLILLLFFNVSSFAKTYEVPILYWSMKIGGQVAMRKGFEEEIDAYNKKNPANQIKLIPYVAGEGRPGILKQIGQFEDAIKKKPAAIVIQPTDNSTLTKGLQKANSLNIPVFVYDQYILDGKLTSYVTSDNYQAGWDNGQYIDSLFPKGKEIRLVVFEYPPVSSTTERVDGFFDALREKGRKFVVLKRYNAVDPGSGAIAVKQFLQDFPEKGSVDAFFTVNDGGGLIIIKTLWEKGRREMRYATVDGDPESVENIKAKKTDIDSAQFCAEMGRESARKLIAHFNNEKFPQKYFIPTFPITIKTVNDYPGWMGRPIASVAAAAKSEAKIEEKKSMLPSFKSSSQEILTLKIGVAPHCPYLCEKGPGVWGGYLYDILKDISRMHNFNLEIVSLPNSRLVSALQTRQVSYIIVPAYLVRYLDNVRIAEPKLGVSFTGALFAKGVKLDIVDKQSLSKRKIVFADLGQESDLNLPAADFSKAMKLTGADVADRMIKMILDHRVDLALGDYNVIRYTIAKTPQLNVQLQPTSMSGFNSLALVSHPKSADFGNLPAHLNVWFNNARQTGKLDKILKNYNLTDWDIFNR